MAEHPVPSRAEVESYLRDRRNWGRWGADDQVGALNLITAEKRLQAVALVRSGRAVSLSRELPKNPALTNPTRHTQTSSASGRFSPIQPERPTGAGSTG
jgi:hypothetical protein